MQEVIAGVVAIALLIGGVVVIALLFSVRLINLAAWVVRKVKGTKGVKPAEDRAIDQAIASAFVSMAEKVGGGGFFGALAVFGYQVFLWLYSGQWVPLSPTYFWPPPYWTDVWIGLHKVVVWIMDAPLALVFLVLGIAGAWLSLVVGETAPEGEEVP